MNTFYTPPSTEQGQRFVSSFLFAIGFDKPQKTYQSTFPCMYMITLIKNSLKKSFRKTETCFCFVITISLIYRVYFLYSSICRCLSVHMSIKVFRDAKWLRMLRDALHRTNFAKEDEKKYGEKMAETKKQVSKI